MDAPTNCFVFAPNFNQPPDEHNPAGNDATGAFIPGARAFEKIYKDLRSSVSVLLFNNKAPGRNRFNEILQGLNSASASQLDAIAYFGHGTVDLMVSASIGPRSMDEFAQAIRANCGVGVTIILYACSCGAPGGFAQNLADKLSDLNPSVFGHLNAGHAYTNPYVRRFPGGSGLQVCPQGCGAGWTRALSRTDLWARFPFMTDDEIRNEI